MDTKKRSTPLPPAVTRWTPIQPAPTRPTQPLEPHRATAGPATPEPGPEAGWTPLELEWVEDAAAEPVTPADPETLDDIELTYDEPPAAGPDVDLGTPYAEADATRPGHEPAAAPSADLDAEDPWTDVEGELLAATPWDDVHDDDGDAAFFFAGGPATQPADSPFVEPVDESEALVRPNDANVPDERPGPAAETASEASDTDLAGEARETGFGAGFYRPSRGPDRAERTTLETPIEPIGAFIEPPRPAWSPPGAVEESARPDDDEPGAASPGSVPLWNPEHASVADAEGWRDLVVPQNLTSAGTDWADEAAAWDTVAAPHGEGSPTEGTPDRGLVERMADQLVTLAAALREEGLPSLERAMRGNRLHAAMASLLVGYAAGERDRGP